MTTSLTPSRVRTAAALATLALVTTGLAATTPASAQPDDAAASSERASRVTQKWGDLSYRAGSKKLSVHGKVKGPRRVVTVQYKAVGGWHTFAKDKTNGKGSYKIRTAFNWWGTHKVRVRVGAIGYAGKARKVKVGDGYAPRGKPKFHNFIKSKGLKWRFNPCQTIRYRINQAHIGKTIVRESKKAMSIMSRATGISVKYVGKTKYVPFKHKGFPKKTDFVLAWATEKKRPGLKGYGGLGGPVWGYQGRDARGKKVWRIDQSAALFNVRYKNGWANGFSSRGATPRGHILLHEIGHAVGLQHVKSNKQIMFGSTWARDGDGTWRSRYAAGDRTGLRQNGAGQGCLRPLHGRGNTGVAGPLAP